MIPKIIHYCWFGNSSKSELIEKCIASWKRYCPDWEIIEWNENNYDIYSNLYVREAYEAKKWAFVSDYVRLDVLNRWGGVYLDTDVEIMEPDILNRYLEYSDVVAFENARVINTGLIYAAESHSSMCRSLLRAYQGKHFEKSKPMINTEMNKPVFIECIPDLKWNGKSRKIGRVYIIGIDEYYAVMKHHGTRSWMDERPERLSRKPNWIIKKLRNPIIFERLNGNRIFSRFLNLYQFLVYDLYDLGPCYYMKLLKNKRKLKND